MTRLEGNHDGTQGPQLRRDQEAGEPIANGNGDRIAGRASKFEWRKSLGAGGNVCTWESFGFPEDSSPGGIAKRLFDCKVEALSEVQARYHIVLKRKVEYEERMSQLQEEIQEIRSIVEELNRLAEEQDKEST